LKIDHQKEINTFFVYN